MPSQRLIRVAREPRLLDPLEPYVRVTVHLANKANDSQLADLDSILRSWSTLGFYCAIPNRQSEQDFGKLVADGDEVEGRRALFRAGGCFKYAGQIRSEKWEVEWLVAWGGVDEAWLDVLLNCLEAYHVQVAPIDGVDLSSEARGA